MLTGGLGSDNATKSSMNISSTPPSLPLQTVRKGENKTHTKSI